MSVVSIISYGLYSGSWHLLKAHSAINQRFSIHEIRFIENIPKEKDKITH